MVGAGTEEGLYLTSSNIGLRCHYLREKVLSKEICMKHISTEDQLPDLLTQTMSPLRFNELINKVVFKLNEEGDARTLRFSVRQVDKDLNNSKSI